MLSPGLHFFLTRVMSRVNFTSLSRFGNIGMRVAVHQACMMPFIQFTLLFASGVLEPAQSLRERIEAGQTRFQQKWRLGFSASLMYWPIVNTFMYSMVQPRFMNLYADVAALFFASVMSYITYSDCSETASRKMTVGSDISDAATAASSGLTTALSTLARIQQTHLNQIMHDGMRAEALQAMRDDSGATVEASDKQLPWLLSTQT